MLTPETQVQDLRQVCLIWEPVDDTYSSPVQHIVHKDDVNKFVQACIELHYNKALDPNTDNDHRPSLICEIVVYKFNPAGPFWWSTPGLGDNDDLNGAKTLESWYRESIPFKSPKQIERDRQYDELED